MSLPYENTTSGRRATEELQRILSKFGCQRFGVMEDREAGEILVQFTYSGRNVQVKASMKGYAAAWLKEHPYTYRTKATKTQHEQKALDIAAIAVHSVVRDWIKGQVTAIETGMLSFEGAFLGQLLLPSGRTVLEEVSGLKLLPQPSGVSSDA